MKQKVSRVFLVAGLFNILGILVLTRGFQDLSVGRYFPELFSFWGLLGVILWGLGYMAMATSYRAAPEILLVFTLEKVVYFASWCWWQWNNFSQLPAIWADTPQIAAFYCGYGPGDLAFGLFFLAVFFQVKGAGDDHDSTRG